MRAEDIGEAHLGAGVEHGVGAGDEGQGGNDDLVAGTDAQRQTGQVQGDGGVGNRQGVLGAGEAQRIRPRTAG